MVVTLVIIGALAAVGAPLFFSQQSFQESGFFNETLSGLRYAQKLAVASGCTVRVSVTANGYSLLRAVNAATCTTGPYTTPVADPSDPSLAFTRNAPAGATFSPAPTTIDFAPLGNASVGVTMSVAGKSFRVWKDTGFVERL